MNNLIKQILKFGIVGVIATVIDYGIMLLLTEVFHVNYLLSSTISFCFSVVFNYIASTKYVFEIGHKQEVKDFVIFIVLSIIGLGINALIMYIGVDYIHVDYRLVKVGATGIVMVYNFVTRKMFIEKKGKWFYDFKYESHYV